MEETDNVSIEKKLAYLNETKSLIKSAIINKGQELTDEIPFRDYVQKIDSIETGVDTSDATATANDIAAEQTAYANGQKVTGTLAIKTSADAPSNIYSINYTSDDSLTFDGEWASKYNRTAFDPGAKFNMIVNQNEIANMISLTPDKIIEGNTILGIEGTGKTSEDLQEQLNAQDLIIQQLQEELAGKASGSAKPNIFVQEEEPVIKNGIWIQSETELENKIAVQTVLSDTGEYNRVTDIPYAFQLGSSVKIGTDIYLLGGGSPNYGKHYKYDTLTNTYTQLTDLPYAFYYGATASVGTDIYLFGGDTNYSKYTYKYDTLTNTYTQLTDIPYNFIDGAITAIGTDIYLFGSSYSYNSNYKKYAYKYDTLTDTYTQLKNIPYEFAHGTVEAVGSEIYIMGGSSYPTNNYKYDTLTNTYTQLTDIPYQFYYCSTVVIGTDIYLLGGSNSKTNNYKYDTATDTFTQLSDITYAFFNGAAEAVGSDIYLLGGSSNTTYNIKFTIKLNTDIPNSSFVFEQAGSLYKTILYSGTFTPEPEYKFTNVWLKDADGNVDKATPVYYGNGTEWIKISGGEG